MKIRTHHLLLAALCALILLPTPAAAGGDPDSGLCMETALSVPEGTVVFPPNGNSMHFVLPPGYRLWERDSDDEGVIIAGDITCECEGGGCDPGNVRGELVCVVRSSCSSGKCQRTDSVELVTPEDPDLGWATKEDLETLPPGPSVLMEIPQIRRLVEGFTAKLYVGREPVSVTTIGNRGIAPDGYHFAPLRVYGHIVSVLVPNDLATEGVIIAGDESCKCNSGSSGCEYWRQGWPVNVSGCESGGCSRCTLNTN